MLKAMEIDKMSKNGCNKESLELMILSKTVSGAEIEQQINDATYRTVRLLQNVSILQDRMERFENIEEVIPNYSVFCSVCETVLYGLMNMNKEQSYFTGMTCGCNKVMKEFCSKLDI